MPDEFLQRLRRFHDSAFPRYRERFRELVEDGQHPSTLFIGCSDSRLVPHLLTGAEPGELFMVRNVGALVPPCSGTSDGGLHGTAAAIEFAVLALRVSRIVVCGHSHCGAMRALYDDVPAEAVNLRAWLELAREAALPVRLFEPQTEAATADAIHAAPVREAIGAPSSPDRHADGLRVEVLRRTEQRSVLLQLERLMDYPMVRRRVERGELSLHGWHYVIEEGEVHVFDVKSGGFIPASLAEHSGSGPYEPWAETAVFNEIDESFAGMAAATSPHDPQAR